MTKSKGESKTKKQSSEKINKNKKIQLLNRPLFSYWQAFYLSFYSTRLYVDVYKRWRGFGILYILLAIFIATIPLSARIIVIFDHYFEEKMMLPLKLLPKIYVQNGKVSSDKIMPYLIKNKEGEVVAIVDNTGTITGMSGNYPDLTILITKDKILYRQPKLPLFSNIPASFTSNEIYQSSLGNTSNEVFVGEDWVKSSGLLKLKLLSEALVYPMMAMFFFSIYMVFILILAMLAQVFSHVLFGVKLRFKEASRLLSVAATPQIAFLFILLSMNITFPGLGFLYCGLVAIYFSYGVISIKRERKNMVLL